MKIAQGIHSWENDLAHRQSPVAPDSTRTFEEPLQFASFFDFAILFGMSLKRKRGKEEST